MPGNNWNTNARGQPMPHTGVRKPGIYAPMAYHAQSADNGVRLRPSPCAIPLVMPWSRASIAKTSHGAICGNVTVELNGLRAKSILSCSLSWKPHVKGSRTINELRSVPGPQRCLRQANQPRLSHALLLTLCFHKSQAPHTIRTQRAQSTDLIITNWT